MVELVCPVTSCCIRSNTVGCNSAELYTFVFLVSVTGTARADGLRPQLPRMQASWEEEQTSTCPGAQPRKSNAADVEAFGGKHESFASLELLCEAMRRKQSTEVDVRRNPDQVRWFVGRWSVGL